MNPGEIALSPNDLVNFPDKNEAEKSLIGKAVSAGREFISTKIQELKEFFTGPMPEAEHMAYLHLISRMANINPEELETVRARAKTKLVLMENTPKQRETVFERMQKGEK